VYINSIGLQRFSHVIIIIISVIIILSRFWAFFSTIIIWEFFPTTGILRNHNIIWINSIAMFVEVMQSDGKLFELRSIGPIGTNRV
jgi:hypothetical protein